MKTNPLSFFLLFLFIPFHNANAGESLPVQEQQKVLSAAAEKASQVFKKFDSISLSWREDSSEDQGKTWKPESRGMLTIDERIKMHSTKKIFYEEENVHYFESTTGEGKLISLQGDLENGAAFSWETKGKLEADSVTARIQKPYALPKGIPIFIEECSRIDVQDLLSPKHIIRLFNDKNEKAIFEVRGGTDDASEVLWFDASSGAILRYFREGFVNGKKKVGVLITFEKHKNIMGWNVPLVKTIFYPQAELSETLHPSKIVSYSVENESVAINTVPKRIFSFYSIKIPVGASVTDQINGISYKQSEISEDLTKGTISQELDKMLEEGRKLKEATQKGKTTDKK
jgi:hypothetical protein